MLYVTYDLLTGNLTGSFMQDMLPEHIDCHIEVTYEQQQNWVNYKYDLLAGELVTADIVEQLPNILPVTRRQAREALLRRGLLVNVNTAIANIPDETVRAVVQIHWEDSLEFYRDNAYVIQIGEAIGLDDEQLDDLFRFAATL